MDSDFDQARCDCALDDSEIERAAEDLGKDGYYIEPHGNHGFPVAEPAPPEHSQFQQPGRRIDCHPPVAHVDIHTDRVCERYQMFPPITTVDNQKIGPSGPHQAAHYPNNTAANIHDFRPDDLVFVEFAFLERQHVGLIDHEQSAHQGFSRRHRIVSCKLHDDALLMKPDPFHLQPGPCSAGQYDRYSIEEFKTAGEVGLYAANDLAFDPPGLHNPGDDNVVGTEPNFADTIHYSRISSTNRFFTFIPAALKIVLIALAVRPCLPMTLPRSCCATLSSKTVVASPSTSLTTTASGLSTSAVAMISTSSFIDPSFIGVPP